MAKKRVTNAELVAALKALLPKAAKPTHINFVGARVYNVDLSEDAVRHARELIAKVEG